MKRSLLVDEPAVPCPQYQVQESKKLEERKEKDTFRRTMNHNFLLQDFEIISKLWCNLFIYKLFYYLLIYFLSFYL